MGVPVTIQCPTNAFGTGQLVSISFTLPTNAVTWTVEWGDGTSNIYYAPGYNTDTPLLSPVAGLILTFALLIIGTLTFTKYRRKGWA